MSFKEMAITTISGMVINTVNVNIAKAFWIDGAVVEYSDGSGSVFETLSKKYADPPKDIFPIWLNEHEVNLLIAHWEKTGMFATVINKIHSAKGIKETK